LFKNISVKEPLPSLGAGNRKTDEHAGHEGWSWAFIVNEASPTGKEDVMKRWFQRFEAMAAAAAFAEAGEWEFAQEIMRRPAKQSSSRAVKRSDQTRPRSERTGYRA
jgi:hypothetical protein